MDANNIDGFVMPANWVLETASSPEQNYVLDYEVQDGPPQVVTLTLNPEAKWNSGDPSLGKTTRPPGRPPTVRTKS